MPADDVFADEVFLHPCHFVGSSVGSGAGLRVRPAAANDNLDVLAAESFIKHNSVHVRLCGSDLVVERVGAGDADATIELQRISLFFADVRRVGSTGVSVVPNTSDGAPVSAPPVQQPQQQAQVQAQPHQPQPQPHPPPPRTISAPLSPPGEGSPRRFRRNVVVPPTAGDAEPAPEAATVVSPPAMKPRPPEGVPSARRNQVMLPQGAWDQCAQAQQAAGAGDAKQQQTSDPGPQAWILMTESDDAAQRTLFTLGLRGGIRSDFRREYVLEASLLGSGLTSEVVWATSLRDHAGVAAKCYKDPGQSVSESTIKHSLERELRVLVACQGHPNIIKYYGLFRLASPRQQQQELKQGMDLGALDMHAPPRCVAMELCGEDLNGDSRRKRAEPLLKTIARGVLSALHHMHTQGFVHRDVKPANILLRKNGEVVLTDFGLACSLEDEVEVLKSCGSAGFCSPEVILKKGCRPTSDVFSLGSTLFFLYCRKVPFGGDDIQSMLRNSVEGKMQTEQTSFSNASKPFRECVRKMLAKKPESRMSTVAALEHPWLRVVTTTTSEIDPIEDSATEMEDRMRNSWSRHSRTSQNSRPSRGLTAALSCVAPALRRNQQMGTAPAQSSEGTASATQTASSYSMASVGSHFWSRMSFRGIERFSRNTFGGGGQNAAQADTEDGSVPNRISNSRLSGMSRLRAFGRSKGAGEARGPDQGADSEASPATGASGSSVVPDERLSQRARLLQVRMGYRESSNQAEEGADPDVSPPVASRPPASDAVRADPRLGRKMRFRERAAKRNNEEAVTRQGTGDVEEPAAPRRATGDFPARSSAVDVRQVGGDGDGASSGRPSPSPPVGSSSFSGISEKARLARMIRLRELSAAAAAVEPMASIGNGAGSPPAAGAKGNSFFSSGKLEPRAARMARLPELSASKDSAINAGHADTAAEGYTTAAGSSGGSSSTSSCGAPATDQALAQRDGPVELAMQPGADAGQAGLASPMPGAATCSSTTSSPASVAARPMRLRDIGTCRSSPEPAHAIEGAGQPATAIANGATAAPSDRAASGARGGRGNQSMWEV